MALIKRTDLYTARLALGPYLVGFVSAVGLYMVVDAFSNLARYSDAMTRGATLAQMVEYFALRIPEVFVMAFPLVHCIALTASAIGLVKRREDLLFLAAGVSMRRMLLGLVLVSVLASLLYLGVREVVQPLVAVQRTTLTAELFRRKSNLTNVVTQEIVGGARRVFHLDQLSASGEDLIATGFHLYESGARTREVHALGASWRAQDRTWYLTDGKAITYDSDGMRREEAVLAISSELPRIRYLHHLDPVAFTTPELWELRGGTIFRAELHRRYSFALGLILLGLLVALASASLSRTAAYAAIAFALVASLVWYGAGFLLSASSTALGPVISAWLLPAAVAVVAGHRWFTTHS